MVEKQSPTLTDHFPGAYTRSAPDANAHTALQAVYNNPNSSEANRVKAASAAIGYEQGKIRDEPPFLELKASIPLKELIPIRLKRSLELEAEQRAELYSAQLLGPGRRNGNGQDGEPEAS
jgi:hypothetical protein